MHQLYAARLSTELGKKGIRVNTVLPGSTDTGMKSEFQKMAGGEQELLREAGAAGRLATSLEMAWPIVFVNSAGASFVSGLELNVDYADTQMKALKLKKDIEDIPVTNPLVLAAAKCGHADEGAEAQKGYRGHSGNKPAGACSRKESHEPESIGSYPRGACAGALGKGHGDCV